LAGNSDYEELLTELYGVLDKDLVDSWNIPFPYGEMPTIIWEEELPVSNQATAQQPTPEVGIAGLDMNIDGEAVA
ncbi:MAG TPA: hypothetical protein PLZ51_14110, partial [Aggregatilineales bacterium]|nr:hypothetical protein [Aggregatilineales bacterium]